MANYDHSKGPRFPHADVEARPNGGVFPPPAELSVLVGLTVALGFIRSGHDINCGPAQSAAVELPDVS